MDKKNKGFTLIEILAVVIIIGLIFILVIHKITNSLKNKKNDIDVTTTNLVLSAAKLYVQDNSSKFDKIDGNISCVPISMLVKKGYLDSKIKNVTDDRDITNTKSVKITYNNKFNYELVDKKECMIVYNIPCDADYCDLSGNEYTEVEYLESTGEQYIDTKVKVDNTIKVDTNLLITSGPDQHIFGVRESYLQNAFGFSKQDYNTARFAYGDNQKYDDESVNLSNYNYYTFDTNKVYINNDQKYEFTQNNILGNLNMYVFAINNNGSPYNQYSYVKMKYFKIWKGGILVRNYIPVLDPSNRPCLYDTLSKQCYYNQGTGEFLYG